MSTLRDPQALFSSKVDAKAPPSGQRSSSTWPLLLTAGVILAGFLGRVWFLKHQTWLNLAPDEAHYWDWSRHLDWSYYSKGPLVAWLIRGSCWLFGQESEWVIRMPAVLCGSLMLLGLAVLTQRIYQRPWLTLALVLLTSLLPLMAVGSLLMTIDAPFVCCWTWAMVLAHVVCFPSTERPRTMLCWSCLGLIITLGILAKYTMVLFLPSLGLFLLLSRRCRPLLWSKGAAAMLGMIGLGCLPILIWNAQNGWVTLHHIGGQAGLTEEFGHVPRWNPMGPLEFLGGQIALLMGVGFLFWGLAIVHTLRSSWRGSWNASSETHAPAPDRQDVFLVCFSLPMFLIFLAFSLKTKVQLNWPIAAYLSGLILTLAWIAERWDAPSRGTRWLVRGGVVWMVLLGGGLTLVMHRTEWLYPLMHPWRDTLTARRWDPSFRLRGATTLAAVVEQLRQELRQQGIDPVLAGTTWNLPGLMAFYLPDRPMVYCLGSLAGDRPSQYDFWPPHPAHQPEVFRGRTFIIVGYPMPRLLQCFERFDPPRVIEHRLSGQTINSWVLSVGHGFRE